VSTFIISDSGPLASSIARATSRLAQLDFADALWRRRLDVWSADPATREKIAHRLGWLDAIAFVTPQLPRLSGLAASIRNEGLSDIVLLGMGGSSLAPEVLREVLGGAAGYPQLRMLDSTDPDAVRTAMDRAATSLFIFASKSGSTIEPNVMAAEAMRRLRESGVGHVGSRFVAITDENTMLHQRALAEGFRDVFVNPSDIGGRYSALSFFGIVPAALIGSDVDRLLASATAMDQACRDGNPATNPGLALGAFMAAGAQGGRDKLTVLVPQQMQSFGLWVEQLIAESTGKHGRGIVPISGEAASAPLTDDRIVVIVNVGGDTPDPALLEGVRKAHVPTITLQMDDLAGIGGEFLRWEIATATAGLLLGINPFDEPNVQQAKDATRALLDTYRERRSLPIPEANASAAGVTFTLSAAAQDGLGGADATSFLRLAGRGDYVAVLAYLPPDNASLAQPLLDFRAAAGAATTCATMFGFGPRYLHSIGQLHKGGANNGVFVIFVADCGEDLPVPGEPFSFGVLELAQAIGDFQSLDRTGRRALLVHLPRRDPTLIGQMADRLLQGR
jgi:glucose-6-phosphate isomerase